MRVAEFQAPLLIPQDCSPAVCMVCVEVKLQAILGHGGDRGSGEALFASVGPSLRFKASAKAQGHGTCNLLQALLQRGGLEGARRSTAATQHLHAQVGQEMQEAPLLWMASMWMRRHATPASGQTIDPLGAHQRVQHRGHQRLAWLVGSLDEWSQRLWMDQTPEQHPTSC